MKLLTNRYTIPVIFRDGNGFPEMDTTPFQRSEFERIRDHGIVTSLGGLVLNAAVHYQGRFRARNWWNAAMRGLNAYLDMSAAGPYVGSQGGLALRDPQNSEFQGKSSEVLAVGLCIDIATRLFGVHRSRVGLIESSGKRCDFKLMSELGAILLESKGRKDVGKFRGAVRSIASKKDASDSDIAYGFVSLLPRNGVTARVEIVDPPREFRPVGRKERIVSILRHYSQASGAAGFVRLEHCLNLRVEAICNSSDWEDFDGRALELDENVIKLGNVQTSNHGSGRYCSFVSPSRPMVFNVGGEGGDLSVGIHEDLYGVLTGQRFGDIDGFQSRNDIEPSVREENSGVFATGTDGTALMRIVEQAEDVQGQFDDHGIA